jgi:hypothetical protein
MNTRARLTPVDVVFIGVAIFVLGNLAPAVYTVLSNNSGELSTGAAYLFQLVFPGLIMTILIVTYVTGVSGG